MSNVSRRTLLKGGAASIGAALIGSNPLGRELLTGQQPASAAALQQMGTPTAQMQAVLDELASFGAPPITDVTPRIARDLASPADAVRSLLAKQGKNIPEPVGSLKYQLVDGSGGESLVARVYTPQGTGPFPVLVYFHGGGWVIANLDTYDSSARALCNAAGCVVVSVAYRQSPEFPFPTPAMDGYSAMMWVMNNTAKINGDPKRVAVGGESAGGNMATVVSMMARDKGTPLPVHQLLVYPVAQLAKFDMPSQVTYADAKPLSTPLLKWFYSKYLANASDATNPYASPLLATDLSKLPPATVIAAQIDPLQSEVTSYADALKKANVPVTYQLFNGVTHEFFGMGAVVDEAKQAVELAAKDLKPRSVARNTPRNSPPVSGH